ncbi:uncharacterized protein A1O9_03069 [Exophiala aquamarina CBS 119918]|uniref:Uncharacterized protein n=1 Tax=Exophiala aquamarina CBS 119918 TaxID=1182545 RepID=A0A072PP32_9EURO|nr:uncharacterized protein A1O9_03069 [Exophiala aquamarina CBS 119918]KEF61502.1 hypothetical protein A1O9_03069 [Exophiala aquamarina CBS 119918]
MPPPSRVPSQQLQQQPYRSGSPTTTAPSVRRNLFSARLSRRPASGSQSSSQGSSSQQHTHSNQHNQEESAPALQNGDVGHEQEQPHHRMPRIAYSTAVPPTVSQVHVASRRYQHQRSVSTPSLSPSPPRLSPFRNLPPAATFSHNAATVTAPPPFAPTPPRHLTAATDNYDPTISPNRPLSPRSRESLFPNSSVIAINPVTGRPILPHLPILPGRLNLTDEDGVAQQGLQSMNHGDEHQEDGGVSRSPDDGFHHPRHLSHTEHDHNDHSPGRAQPQHFYTQARAYSDHPSYQQHSHQHHQHQPPDSDMNHAHPSTATMMRAAAEDEASLEADEERRDRERIERLLRELMGRQRARANINSNKSSSSTVGNDPPSSSSAARAMASSGLRKHGTLGGRHQHAGITAHNDDDHVVYAAGDEAGAEDSEESEAEREELMGLITASLRREVARAEDEGWMYGDSGMGMGTGWDGREEGLVGGYD